MNAVYSTVPANGVTLPTLPASASGGPLGGSWSFETWAYFTAAPSDHARIFELGTTSGSDLIYLQYNSDYSPARFEVGVYQGGSRVSYAASSAASMPVSGAWFHLVLSVAYTSGSGYAITFYVNGNAAGTGSWGASSGPLDLTRTINLLGATQTNWGSSLSSASLAEVVSPRAIARELSLIGQAEFMTSVVNPLRSLVSKSLI